MTARANWGDDAACRDADPELFFPIGTDGPALRQIDEAKRICRACPAETECLAWALDQEITDGVWGGTTLDERRVIRRLRRRMSTRQKDASAESCQPAVPDKRTSSRPRGGFARDFATADGKRVRVEAFTAQQFADLVRTTGLAGTFAFLERVLDADFCASGGLHTHRVVISALLAPWFARHSAAEQAAAFAGTSVRWAHLRDLTGSVRHADGESAG